MNGPRRKNLEAINAQWDADTPSGLSPDVYIRLRNGNVHLISQIYQPQGPLVLRANAVAIEPAVSREEAMPVQPVVGGGIEEDDTVEASGTVTVTFDAGSSNKIYTYSGKPGRSPRIAMPPGLWMSRIARYVFFFSPKTVERVFEPIIDDFRHEVLKAEAEGKTADLRRLRIQNWGVFVHTVIYVLWDGTLGKIIRAFIGAR